MGILATIKRRRSLPDSNPDAIKANDECMRLLADALLEHESQLGKIHSDLAYLSNRINDLDSRVKKLENI